MHIPLPSFPCNIHCKEYSKNIFNSVNKKVFEILICNYSMHLNIGTTSTQYSLSQIFRTHDAFAVPAYLGGYYITLYYFLIKRTIKHCTNCSQPPRIKHAAYDKIYKKGFQSFKAHLDIFSCNCIK